MPLPPAHPGTRPLNTTSPGFPLPLRTQHPPSPNWGPPMVDTTTNQPPPAAHIGVPPGWDCAACRKPWPCDQAKARLLAEYRKSPSSLTVYMHGHLAVAIADLNPAPADLWSRFIAWTRPAPTPPPSRDNFAGAPPPTPPRVHGTGQLRRFHPAPSAHLPRPHHRPRPLKRGKPLLLPRRQITRSGESTCSSGMGRPAENGAALSDSPYICTPFPNGSRILGRALPFSDALPFSGALRRCP